MNRHRTNTRAAALAALVFLLLSFHSADATIIDFNGLHAGTVVAGQDPTGVVLAGDFYDDFIFSCINNGSGPASIVIFNSEEPTGEDVDLGTPHQDFGGPGVGRGGREGQPGENNLSLGNLAIIAENTIDGDGDGLVDDPDDEACGGVYIFEFTKTVIVQRVVLIDVDCGETAEVRLYGDTELIATLHATPLGSNSVQTLDGSSHLGVQRMEVELSSSGAVGEIEYVLDMTPVEHVTWGALKASYDL
jgi:hypothetical protein